MWGGNKTNKYELEPKVLNIKFIRDQIYCDMMKKTQIKSSITVVSPYKQLSDKKLTEIIQYKF